MRYLTSLGSVSVVLLLTSLSGCGGSGTDSAGYGSPLPASDGSFVLVDRSAGTQDVATAVVSGVMYEDLAGGMTANLLDSPTELYLTNEQTRLCGLSLHEAPRATYRAMHLVFVPGSQTVRWKTGGWDPIQAPTSLRLQFKAPVEIRRGDWIQLSHGGPVAFRKDAQGKVQWDPDLVPEYRSSEVLHAAVLEVVNIEAGQLAAWGEFDGLRKFVVRMQFSDPALLVRDGNVVASASEFVRGLRIGTQLVVDGILRGNRTLEVVSAEDLSWPEPPVNTNQGVKTKVLASIARIASQSGVMRVNVLQVLRHGRGPLPPRTVDLHGAQAKIKWSPHQNQTPKPVSFSALKPGMVIEAEWKTPDRYGTPLVTKIRIKADA